VEDKVKKNSNETEQRKGGETSIRKKEGTKKQSGKKRSTNCGHVKKQRAGIRIVAQSMKSTDDLLTSRTTDRE